jgi:hypothetical protein
MPLCLIIGKVDYIMTDCDDEKMIVQTIGDFHHRTLWHGENDHVQTDIMYQAYENGENY